MDQKPHTETLSFILFTLQEKGKKMHESWRNLQFYSFNAL